MQRMPAALRGAAEARAAPPLGGSDDEEGDEAEGEGEADSDSERREGSEE